MKPNDTTPPATRQPVTSQRAGGQPVVRQFALTFGAALLGSFTALVLYDRMVLQPRALAQPQPGIGHVSAVQGSDTPAAIVSATAGSPVDWAQQQQAAVAAAAALDATVKRSVADARAALDAQASEEDRRRLALEALHRADGLKVAMTEAYLTNGQWPASLQEIGMGVADGYAGGAVASIGINASGVVTVVLNQALAAGAKIRLAPTVRAQASAITWHCSIEGPDELRRFLPACREAPPLAR